jgi:hypothetical protein
MAMLRFSTRSFPTWSCQGGQIRAGVLLLRLFKRLQHPSRNSRAEQIWKIRVLFGIVCVFVGAYAHSPSAMAEVEEMSPNQDDSTYSGSTPIILRGLINNIIEIENNTDYDLSSVDYYHINNVHIPEAVWNLDASTGIHLDRVSAGSESVTYAVSVGRSNEFGGRLGRADFWSRTTLGLWNDNAANPGPNLLIPPAFFQVASCGGSSAERNNLDYCGSNEANNANADQFGDSYNKYKSDSSTPTTQFTGDNVGNSSNIDSTSSLKSSAASNINPILPSNFLMSGELTLVGGCDGVSISCAPIDITQPAALIDSSRPESPTPVLGDQTPPFGDQTPPFGDQTPLIGDQTPPIGDQTPPIDPAPLIGSSGSGGAGPVSDQNRPIPEAPTWVMTAIGFGIVAFIFRKKKNNHNNSISIIDNAEI